MNNNNCYSKIFTVGLIILPIINQYLFFYLTFLELFALVGVILALILKINIKLNKYLVFLIYGFFSSLLVTFVLIILEKNFRLITEIYILRMTKYLVLAFGIVIASGKLFDIRIARKSYTIIVLLVSIVLVFQYLLHLMFGLNTYLLIPNVTLNYNDNMNSTLLILKNLTSIQSGFYYRPSSIFIEPAHFSIFVLPWLAMELAIPRAKFRNISLIFVSVSIVVTTSTLGLVVCSVLWVVFFFRKIFSLKNMRINMKYIILLLIFIFVLISIVLSDENIQNTINIKIKSINNIQDSSSLTLRLLRGLYYFKEIGWINKVFGVGYGNLTAYYDATHMFLPYDYNLQNVTYMNGLMTILNSFGILGLFFYIRWWFYSLKFSQNIQIENLCIVVFLLLLGSDIFFSASFWLMSIFILTLLRTKESRLI